MKPNYKDRDIVIIFLDLSCSLLQWLLEYYLLSITVRWSHVFSPLIGYKLFKVRIDILPLQISYRTFPSIFHITNAK